MAVCRLSGIFLAAVSAILLASSAATAVGGSGPSVVPGPGASEAPLRLAQATPSETGEDDARRRVTDRLSMLDRDKLDALMERLGRTVPKDFYGCLCGSYWRAGHVGVSYRDGKCHFSGFGEWDEPLPNDGATWAGCIDSQRYEDGSSLVDVISGEVKALRDKRKAAEAAKAAEAGTAAKGPASTVAGYDADVARLLTDLRMRGYPMNRVEQLNAMIRGHIMTLDQPGQLPGFWESLGLEAPPPADAADLARWRAGMLAKWDRRFVGLLQSGDPNTIFAGIRQTSKALGKYDAGLESAAEGALDEIAGNQKFVEDMLSTVPVVGDVIDAVAVAGWLAGDGRWTLTGEKVSGVDAFIRFAGLAVPGMLDKLAASSTAAGKYADDIGGAAAMLGDKATAKALAEGVGRKADDVARGTGEIASSFVRKNEAAVRALDDKAAAAGKAWAETADGIADLNRKKLDEKLAGDLIERFGKAKPGSPAFEDALRQLQANKTAQALVNGADVPDSVREAINTGLRDWYKTTDAGTMSDLKHLLGYSDDAAEAARRLGVDEATAKKMRDRMAAYAREKGLPLQDFQIDVKTITNKRPVEAGAASKVKVGRDRDVTFEIVAPDGRRFDVDHEVSEAIYEQNFWKTTNKGTLPMAGGVPDKTLIHSYAHETMDQTVTSKWHKEAYNSGEVQLDDFLTKGTTPTITRVEDLRDTITVKSDIWFDRAAKATSATDQARNVAEGMRQATKQYDDLILSRLKSYNMNPAAVPPTLQSAMAIFRKVESGAVSPKQAEAMLAAIGTSPRKAVQDMGSMFETMEKVTGKAVRAEGAKEVAAIVKSFAGSGGPNWHNTALSAINDGLRNGQLSAADFMSMRGDVIRRAQSELPPLQRAPWAEAARAKGLISADELDLLLARN